MKRTTEDYLKTIHLLEKKSPGVRSVSVAEELGVSRPTVCVTLRRLETEGFITKNKDYEIFLTECGRKIAESMIERHLTFEKLLTGLGVDKKIATMDACKMEHAVSPESFAALKNLTERKSKI